MLGIEPAEDAIQLISIFVFIVDDGGCVSECQNVFAKPAVVRKDVVDYSPEESDIGSRPNGHVLIAHGGRSRKMRIDMDQLGAALTRHHRKAKSDRMRFSHV